MTSHWKAVLGIILIYIFGCFSGAASISIFFHHRMIQVLQHPAQALSAALEKRLTGNLGLDPKQKEQVHTCFLENLRHRKELQKEIQPRVQTLNQQTVQQVTAILRPDQAELFHQNIERLEKRFGTNASDSTTPSPSAPAVLSGAPATNSGAGSPP